MLSKRQLYSMCTVIIMALVGYAQAVDFSDTGDGLWSTPANWSTGSLPGAGDWVKISNTNSAHQTVTIGGGVDALSLKTHVGYTGGGTLIVDGGSLTTSTDDLLLGKNGGSGTLNMTSGTVNVGKDLEVGGGNPGSIHVTGGTINIARDFDIPESVGTAAEVNLEGGMITVGGALTMSATGSMDITGGTLIVSGDVTVTINAYITNGWITASEGMLNVDFDTITPGKTTVTTAAVDQPPTKAANPNPTAGATGVRIDPTLSWTPGLRTSLHDVYFGTDPTPDAGEFQRFQNANIFKPGTLNVNTTYYWRVDEKNDYGTTAGDVWSFTTTDQPPTKAADPAPTNGKTNVSTTPMLLWTPGVNVSSHDVYFGTDSTPDAGEFQGNQTENIFRPGTLNLNTTYYWRIDERNALGTTVGDVWIFTTRATTASEIIIVPSGTGDDSYLIQSSLDNLKTDDTLRLSGDFVIGSTIYLPSNFTWILNGTLTLGDNADLNEAGWVDPPIDATRPTGISETPGGATNIDMSGGTYYGNYAGNSSSLRFINFVQVTGSKFHDMVMTDVSDDIFTIGPGCRYNECRNLVGSFSNSGNALTDKGDHNKWYDCISEDCGSDGFTPKCRYSEFYRCIARRNDGPGFGMYCRIDGSGNPVDLGEAIDNNKFYACVSHDNDAAGFSFNISSTSGEGGSIRNNYVEAVCYNNKTSGVRFRNKMPNSIVADNEINLLCYGNRGLKSDGSLSSIAGGLGTDASSSNPISGITGTMVSFDNIQYDVNTGNAYDCDIAVYHPDGENAPVLKTGDASNSIAIINYNCSSPLDQWCMQSYCELFVCGGLADFNCDGSVDVTDLSYMTSVWLTDDTKADIFEPADGIVNLLDLSILSLEWLQ